MIALGILTLSFRTFFFKFLKVQDLKAFNLADVAAPN